jgi:hypothetical protein
MPVFSSVLALLQRLQLTRDVSRAGSLQVQAIADVLTILKSSSCTALDLDACQPTPLPFPSSLVCVACRDPLPRRRVPLHPDSLLAHLRRNSTAE